MIAVRNPVTNGVEIVASLDGCEDWEIVADPAPADFLQQPYQIVDGVFVPDLPAARARQRAIINAARDAAQDGGCVVPGVGPFDTGERARQFINGAVSVAQIAMANGQPFSMQWTLADNSTVTLDAAGLINAALVVAFHVDAMHSRARVLKGRIDAAETLAEIAAIGWTLAD